MQDIEIEFAKQFPGSLCISPTSLQTEKMVEYTTNELDNNV